MFSFSLDHHVNSLSANSLLLSPATSNLIAMKRRKIDRTGYKDPGYFIGKHELCRMENITDDELERYLYEFP